MLLNADYWKTPRDYWSKISFFSPLRFLILKNSILMELFMRCKTLSSSFLLKSERFHQSSQKFLLCYQCFSCLIIVGKVVNLLFIFIYLFINICYLHDFFPCSFHVILALVEVMVSMGVFIYISVPFEYLMKNCVD